MHNFILNTDSYKTSIETALLRAVWYPTTVATVSWHCRTIIERALRETADDLSGLPFKLHDFGARGATSDESTALAGMAHTLSILGWSVLGMSCAMILITLIDIPVQLQQHQKKLRMTLQQVKDEMKDTDGRPEVKQRIRQLQYQMAQNKMLGDVPQADVIITNPEHYAVALRYDQGKESAPVMLAKGADLIALKIREIGTLNHIPIVSSPALARAIYFNTEVGEEIPGGLYMAVAQVLAYIFQLKQFNNHRGRRPILPTDLQIPDDLQHD